MSRGTGEIVGNSWVTVYSYIDTIPVSTTAQQQGTAHTAFVCEGRHTFEHPYAFGVGFAWQLVSNIPTEHRCVYLLWGG